MNCVCVKCPCQATTSRAAEPVCYHHADPDLDAVPCIACDGPPYGDPGESDESDEQREAAAIEEALAKARTGFECEDCGHRHTGPQFGWICIGCPCERRAS